MEHVKFHSPIEISILSVYTNSRSSTAHFIFIPDPKLFTIKREKKEKNYRHSISFMMSFAKRRKKNLKKLSFFKFVKKEEKKSSEDKREKSNIGHRHLIFEHNSLNFDFKDLR